MKSDSFNIKIQFGILLFSLLTINGATAQGVLYNIIEYPVIPKVYCEMNKKVNETSGLLLFDRGIWTFNDSGGKPELYRIEKESGKISQKITLENGENYDWEDITGDEEYIYIGDFGNNKGNRKDLKIYKIAKKHIGSKKKTKVRAEIINFSYNDQESFVVNNRKNNYDCESVISFGDSLIIFSKNWVNEKTRMYKLPKTPGMYDLDPLDSFDVDGLITGADFNSKTNELILIGYKYHRSFVFLFTDFNGRNFDGGDVYRINFPRLNDAQTEGIIWLDDSNILFSTEQTKVYEQQIFQFDLTDVLKYVED